MMMSIELEIDHHLQQMFYSHQLLARKAPLGQIWMAATMHAKMNRKKLNQLNLISICEEILNPSVPMALRLSGILMGGVVIVYERKVKLLYDDVTRLLVEINEAWKVKAVPDPTVLPKGKSQARKEALTLPENFVDADDDEAGIERSRSYSATTMHLQRSAYIAMRLDTIDEPYTSNDHGEEDASHQLHQVDADNIKLFERFDSYQANANTYNRFDRFDMEGDDETQMNFTSAEHVEIPTTLVPSPPPAGDAADMGQQFEEAGNVEEKVEIDVQPDECRDGGQGQTRRGPVKRKIRQSPALDYEQTMIPGHIYQTWLQCASGIVSRSGRNKKARRTFMSTMKIANLMELPPLVLIDNPFRTRMGEIPYPAPLMQLWLRSTQPPHDSPSARTSPPLPPEPPVSSPLERMPNQDARGFFFDDFQNGGGSESWDAPMEKLRFNLDSNGVHAQAFMEDLGVNLNGVRITEPNITTPIHSGDDVRSIPSSGPGNSFQSHADANSGRSNKKRPFHSSSRHSSSGLEPVAEESSFPDPNFKMSRLSENGLTPELLVETGPTQTQYPIHQPIDKLTDSIRMSMKVHFEMPGAPKTESLNKLAAGMNRKGAALLFYQTCVLAASDFLRVKQEEPYGDIILSRGAKM